MGKYLYLFRILYLILLLFMLANFLLGFFWLRIYATSLESLAVSWSSDGY